LPFACSVPKMGFHLAEAGYRVKEFAERIKQNVRNENRIGQSWQGTAAPIIKKQLP
jgi:hypothetical protein